MKNGKNVFYQWLCGATGKQQCWRERRGGSSKLELLSENTSGQQKSHHEASDERANTTAWLDKQVARTPDNTNSNTACPGSRWTNTRRTRWHFPPLPISMTTKVPRHQQASDHRSDACCWPVVGRETKKLKSRQCRPECPDITASVCSHQPPRAHEGNQPPGAGANNTATLPLRDNNGGTEPLLADVVKSPQEKGRT